MADQQQDKQTISIFSQHRSSPNPPRTPGEERVLKSLYLCQYLTIPQLACWHHPRVSRSTLTHVAATLKSLAADQFILRGFLGRSIRFGSNPSVFRLAPRGIRHLSSLGYTPLPRFHSSVFPSYGHLQHTLQLNDFLIAALRLPSFAPEYQVIEVQHDWMFRQHPIALPKSQPISSHRSVIPDGWIDFRLPKLPDTPLPPRLPVHVEYDRASEYSIPFEEKLRALLVYINGPYEARFHTPLVTIAFVTTKGQTRLSLMRSITQHVLRSMQAEDDASIFYFASLPEGTLDPCQVFLTPLWYTPFDDTPKVLLSAEV